MANRFIFTKCSPSTHKHGLSHGYQMAYGFLGQIWRKSGKSSIRSPICAQCAPHTQETIGLAARSPIGQAVHTYGNTHLAGNSDQSQTVSIRLLYAFHTLLFRIFVLCGALYTGLIVRTRARVYITHARVHTCAQYRQVYSVVLRSIGASGVLYLSG
jgi:hypothetical protein